MLVFLVMVNLNKIVVYNLKKIRWLLVMELLILCINMLFMIKLLVCMYMYVIINMWYMLLVIIGDCLYVVIKIIEISKELYLNVKYIIKLMKNKGYVCIL